MTYDELKAYLQNLLQVNAGNTASFDGIFPAALNDAEGRIYREMDFLATRDVNASVSFTTNSRSLTLPAGTIVCQAIAAITPAPSIPSAGTRNTLEPVSLDFIDYSWPQEVGVGATGVPQYFALLNETTAIVAPTPAAAYVAEITRTIRPATLSDSNQSNFLSLVYPDILLAACMVFLSGYQREFANMSEGPQMGTTWEQHYVTLRDSVLPEDQRRKHASTNWSPYSPTPLSTPRR